MNSENTNPTSSASAATVLDRPQTALRFRFIGGQRHGQVIRIAANKCTIGSSEEATFRLKCAGVHAVHCLILRGEGGTAIKRLGDDTLLNGEAFEDAQLSEGDRLTIGPLEFEVLGEAAANTTGNQPSSQERAAFEAQRAEWERQRDQEQQDLETRRQELEQQAQAIEEERQAIQAQTEENQQSEEAQEEVAQLRAQLEQAEVERNDVSQLREQLEQAETQRTEAEQQWNQTREELQSELESLKSETQDNSNEEEIAELRTQCEELTRQLEEASQQQQSQTDWTALQATWDTERSQFQTDLDSAQLQISELTQRCTQAEESANDTSFAESMSALEARLTEVEAAREQDREEFEASQQRDREELATAQEQLESMRAEVERLEAERAAAQAEPAPAAFAPEAPSYENYAEQPGLSNHKRKQVLNSQVSSKVQQTLASSNLRPIQRSSNPLRTSSNPVLNHKRLSRSKRLSNNKTTSSSRRMSRSRQPPTTQGLPASSNLVLRNRSSQRPSTNLRRTSHRLHKSPLSSQKRKAFSPLPSTQRPSIPRLLKLRPTTSTTKPHTTRARLPATEPWQWTC